MTLALAARLPTISNLREEVEVGALMSYGPSVLELFLRAAEYVDKILRGAKPVDLPVEQPTSRSCHQPRDRQGARSHHPHDFLVLTDSDSMNGASS